MTSFQRNDRRTEILKRMAVMEGRLSMFRPWSALEQAEKILGSALASQDFLKGVMVGAAVGGILGIIGGLIGGSASAASCFILFLLIGTTTGAYRGARLGLNMIRQHRKHVEDGVHYHLHLSRKVAKHTYGLDLNEG